MGSLARAGLSWCADICVIEYWKNVSEGGDIRALDITSAVDESVSFLAYLPGLSEFCPSDPRVRRPGATRFYGVENGFHLGLIPWDLVARCEELYIS